MVSTARKEVKGETPKEGSLAAREPLTPAGRLNALIRRGRLCRYTHWKDEELEVWPAPSTVQKKCGLVEFGAILASSDGREGVVVRFAKFEPRVVLRTIGSQMIGISHLIGVQEDGETRMLCVGHLVDRIEGGDRGVEKIIFTDKAVVFGRVRAGEGERVTINPPGTVEEFLESVVEILEVGAGQPLIEASEAGVRDFADSHAAKAREELKRVAAETTLGRTMPLVREMLLMRGPDWVVIT